MRTPPMVKAMNERETKYNEKRLVMTLTSSKHNFYKSVNNKIESSKDIPEPKDDIFILRLQDRSRRLLQDHLQGIKDRAE